MVSVQPPSFLLQMPTIFETIWRSELSKLTSFFLLSSLSFRVLLVFLSLFCSLSIAADTIPAYLYLLSSVLSVKKILDSILIPSTINKSSAIHHLVRSHNFKITALIRDPSDVSASITKGKNIKQEAVRGKHAKLLFIHFDNKVLFLLLLLLLLPPAILVLLL